MRKKLLAIVLSFAVVLAYMPAAAFAETGDGDQGASDSVAVASAEELQTALENEAEYIELTEDISADRTFYVVSDATIFSNEEKAITRAADFTGDIFVVGEDAEGKDVIGDLGKDAVTFNIGLKDGSDKNIVLDGNNVASQGTAIFVMNSSTVNLYSSAKIRNFKKTGNTERTARSEISKASSPEQAGGAAAIVSGGTLNIRGAELDNNTVNSETKDGPASTGGAIYNFGTVKIYAGSISGSKAYYGGAIYNYRTVKVYGGTFDGNAATYGGAISNVTSQYAQIIMGGGSVSGDGILFSGNAAGSTGGAIYLTNSSGTGITGLIIYDDAKAAFEGNSSVNHGGAIYTYGTTKIDGASFTSNESKCGGAIEFKNGNKKESVKNSTFTGNAATEDGGAVYVDSGAKVDLSCSAFEKNSAGKKGGAVYEGAGSNLIVDDNCTFSGNTGETSAGAIYVADNSSGKTHITIKDSTFAQNKALGTHGGAMYLYTNTVADISGCKYMENTSVQNGGAIYINGSEAEITSTEFKGNSIAGSESCSGGAVYTTKSTTKMNNVDFNNNSVTSATAKEGNGGAIGMATKSVTYINNSNFASNSASYRGGGIHLAADSNVGNVYNSVFDSNTAANYGGGFVATTNNTGHLYNDTFTNNAGSSGKAMWFYNNTESAIVYGCTVNGAAASTDVTQIRVSGNEPVYYPIDYEQSYVEVGIPQNPFEETVVPVEETVELDSVDAIFAMDGASDVKDSSYSIGKALNNSSNFQSRSTSEYEIDGIGKVTADTFIYQPGNAANNPNVGEGILIYQAMLYKKAHPEENVSIDLSSYRFSAEAAVNINRNSSYFGYMRSLPDSDYDEYGFVRISYLLLSAAKMGIDVTITGQRTAVNDKLDFAEYYEGHMKDPCDASYAPDQKVKNHLQVVKSDWDYVNKDATDLMHTKACAVSAYIDKNGNEHGGSVWLSSSNLDNIKSNGRNVNDSLQTGIIISDHEKIYRVTKNYLGLIQQYSTEDGIYDFRNLVNRMATEQIDKLDKGEEIAPDEQILYRDDVFELYFSAIGGDNAKWDETYNCFSRELKNLESSDGYIWFGMNNPKYKSFAMSNTMQRMLVRAFHENADMHNRLDINIGTIDGDDGTVDTSSAFNTAVAAYDDLEVGKDIGFKSIENNDYEPIHSKDMLFSYSKNGVRSYVSIISSMNMHEGSASYQSNFALVVKENSYADGTVFRTIAQNGFKGLISKEFIDQVIELKENDFTFSGEAIEPEAMVPGLTKDVDYSIRYENNINAGTARVIADGIGDFAGNAPLEAEFTIKPLDISKAEVNVADGSYAGGEEVTPEVTVKVGGKILSSDNYDVSYSGNINVGDNAKVVVKGKGNLTGDVSLDFVVKKKSIKNAELRGIPASAEYTGAPVRLNAVLTVDGKVLEYGVDYEIYEKDSQITEEGDAVIVYHGIGNYEGYHGAEFVIVKRSLSDAVVSSISDKTYTGKYILPSVTVKYNGEKLVKDVDYKVTGSRKSVGKGTVTIKGIGKYKGTRTKTYRVIPKGTSIKSAAGAKKAFTVKWTKISTKMSTNRITGYQVRYSTSSKMTSPKTVSVSGYSKYSKKISKLKAKKYYYVQVRTYMTVSGTKYYSSWSKSKKVKTK